MKKKTTKSKSAGEATPGTPNTKLIRIEFTHPTAQSVSVAGTFNDWHPGATEMIAMGNGRWVKELTLPPGFYEYRLVVDGEWMANPNAPESAANPYGGINSVLRVTTD
jgi:1,4-alpha-glucan branching enzyme